MQSKTVENEAMDQEDRDWLESDLSRLGEVEPYEWGEGELEEGQPLKYIPGIGLVIEDT